LSIRNNDGEERYQNGVDSFLSHLMKFITFSHSYSVIDNMGLKYKYPLFSGLHESHCYGQSIRIKGYIQTFNPRLLEQTKAYMVF
jgi:hypothetical protein